MHKKIGLIFVAVLVLALTACTRSASTPPPGTSDENGANLVVPLTPNATTDPMVVLQLVATQTAMALSGASGTPMAPTFTPMITSTPDPNNPALPTPTPVTAGGSTQPVAPVAYATSTPGIPATYTLQAGEFPYCIARRFNVNPDELLALNGLSGGQTYSPGLTLNIPQTGHTFPGETALIPHPATHTVASGETVYTIACKYGDADPNEIIAANGLQSPYTLTVGKQISVP